MSPQVAVDILWGVWYLSWIAAVIWSARTRIQLKTDRAGLNRLASGLGSLLLFYPFHPPRPGEPLGLMTAPLWSQTGGLAWVLLGLTLVPFGFCWWARLHLGRLWSGFVTLKADHRIIDTGPYGWVRHPIYSGVIAAALLLALIRATPVAFIGLALFAWGFSMTARIEERFLRQQLGAQAYDAYSRRVAMFIPGLK